MLSISADFNKNLIFRFFLVLVVQIWWNILLSFETICENILLLSFATKIFLWSAAPTVIKRNMDNWMLGECIFSILKLALSRCLFIWICDRLKNKKKIPLFGGRVQSESKCG
jgi:hypothetical protein